MIKIWNEKKKNIYIYMMLNLDNKTILKEGLVVCRERLGCRAGVQRRWKIRAVDGKRRTLWNRIRVERVDPTRYQRHAICPSRYYLPPPLLFLHLSLHFFSLLSLSLVSHAHAAQVNFVLSLILEIWRFPPFSQMDLFIIIISYYKFVITREKIVPLTYLFNIDPT